MPWRIRQLVLALTFLCAAASLVAGCSKYDHLERNMQYVSDTLLRQDAQVSWDSLVKAHDAWRASGGGHEPDNAAYNAYKDAYAQYAIVYNELADRNNGGFSGRLHAPADELPSPPPGASLPAGKKAAPADDAAPVAAPNARELNDASPAAPVAPTASKGIPMAAPARSAAATPAKDNPFALPKGEAPAASAKKTALAASASSAAASGDRYVIAPGDTLRSIAKRHGVSEKSLMEANGITDPDKIASGKALTIPARQ